MQYPVRSSQDWREVGRTSLAQRLAVRLRSWRYAMRESHDGISLQAADNLKPGLHAQDPVLICIVRNAESYLPSFLDHYRRLGIGRFAFVDDRSVDATGAILAAAKDVDVFHSNVDFRQSSGGRVWRDMLVDIYGRGRWYVVVDCDEYLLFPGSEHRSVQDFISDLDLAGRKRALAVMLDIYPDAPLDQAPHHFPPQAPPTDFCPLFDSDSYTIGNDKLCTAIRGGPRSRMFGADMRLTKFPVIFADAATRFAGGTHHAPLPLDRNFSPVQAVLLHYKFPAGAVADFQKIAEQGSHFDGSRFYKQIIGHQAFHEDMDLRYAGSKRFTGTEALVAGGFMQDLRIRG